MRVLIRFVILLVWLCSLSSSYASCASVTPNDLPDGANDSASGVLENLNGLNDRGRILFCKDERITNAATTVVISSSDLTGIANGSKSISLGAVDKNSPIVSSVEIAGGTPIVDIPLKSVGYYSLPNVGPAQHLFHFYYQCRYNWNYISSCQRNRKNWFLEALRKNTDIFVVGGQTGTPSTSGNNIVTFSNVLLGHEQNSSTKILANVRFRYQNLGVAFNDKRPKGFLHFGVWAEIEPITNSSGAYAIKKSKNYTVEAYINTNGFTNHVTNKY